jgi:hypothetical protein
VSVMEFWTKVASIAAFGQVVVLIATAVFVWRYLQETAELRRTAQQQVALANEQLEAQIKPALIVEFTTAAFLCVSNVGSGTGFNLRLVKTKVELIDWAAESNFGIGARGRAVAVGHPVDTAEPRGSVGTLKGEHLQLFYESLSGKTYASVVMFEGDGTPSGVRFPIKG